MSAAQVIVASPTDEPAARLAALRSRGGTQAEALALFDALPAATIQQLTGRWKGFGVPTGHAMDGLLERYGWYGKEFLDADSVHPLLFSKGHAIVAVQSRFLPIGLMTHPALQGGFVATLFKVLLPLLTTRRPTARLRMLEHRGCVSATMIYDYLPINDVFRRVDQDTVLGLMDLRGTPQPFFFGLQRVGAPSVS